MRPGPPTSRVTLSVADWLGVWRRLQNVKCSSSGSPAYLALHESYRVCCASWCRDLSKQLLAYMPGRLSTQHSSIRASAAFAEYVMFYSSLPHFSHCIWSLPRFRQFLEYNEILRANTVWWRGGGVKGIVVRDETTRKVTIARFDIFILHIHRLGTFASQ
jgi:hypothetical protein